MTRNQDMSIFKGGGLFNKVGSNHVIFLIMFCSPSYFGAGFWKVCKILLGGGVVILDLVARLGEYEFSFFKKPCQDVKNFIVNIKS